jgi:endonuclease YncB( thermonuclease family)
VCAAALPLEAHPETGATFMVGGCKLETIGPGFVTAIVDSRTVALDGAREARLSAIETGSADPQAHPSTLLASLIGRAVILRRVGPEQDRYGRLLVHLFVSENGSERWIQADLVEHGDASVSARVGDPACAGLLLAREDKARKAKLGM